MVNSGQVDRSQVLIVNKPARVAELDLLRFLAALAVMLYHRITPQFSTYGAAQFGFLGVELFFMISGFVILWTGMTKNTTEFIASRVSRLYPTYWACVVLTWIAIALSHQHLTLSTVLANLTMFPGIFRAPLVDSVYWTLSIEIKFYVLVFLLIVVRQMHRIERWLAGWLALSLGEAMMPGTSWLRQLTLEGYSTYFIAGALLYLMRTHGANRTTLSALAVSLALGLRHGIYAALNAVHSSNAHVALIADIVVLIEYGVFFCIALRIWHFPETKLWAWLGAMTYPLYLIHDRAGNVMLEWLPDSLNPSLRLGIVISLIVMIAAALAATTEQICPTFNKWLLNVGRRSEKISVKYLPYTPSPSPISGKRSED